MMGAPRASPYGGGGGKGGGLSLGGGIEAILKGLEYAGALPQPPNGEMAVFVGGLPTDCTDNHLYRIFTPFGAISSKGVKAMLNEDTMPDGTIMKVAIKSPAAPKGAGKGPAAG